MYVAAYAESDEVVFYFDAAGNKYVAKGGSLAWRLNNPGLIPSRSSSAKQFGAIGKCGPYAIFPSREAGFKAQLATAESKRGEGALEGESFRLLPRIVAKIERGKERSYLVNNQTLLSREEAIEWVTLHNLDAIVVRDKEGKTHLRSRSRHAAWKIKSEKRPIKKIGTLVRVTGRHEAGQPIWAFLNGIDNTKEEAIASATAISLAAGGQQVLSMPNDASWIAVDLMKCIAMKFSLKTPLIRWTKKFLRYLLSLASPTTPVIVFAHSQGAILVDEALDLLKEKERTALRIFTFGGGSFIRPGKTHPDSHNFASAADFVCRLASPDLQLLALERYWGQKKGLSEQKIISLLAKGDAQFLHDVTDVPGIRAYTKQRKTFYREALRQISNLTILDPDPDQRWKHIFMSHCYQQKVREVIDRYRSQKAD